MRENAVAQSQGRIAKPFQVQPVQQFVIDRGAGNNNFRPPEPDAFNFSALRYRQARDAFGNPRHVDARDDVSLPALASREMAATAARDAAVPEVAITFLIFAAVIRSTTLLTSRAMKPRKLRQFPFARRIVTKEFIGQANRAQTEGSRHRGCVRPATRSVHNFHPRDPTLGSETDRCGRLETRPKVDEPRFFHPGDNLDSPSRRGSYPFQECLGIARIPHGAGCDHSHRICNYLLCCTVKAAQNFHRFGHGLGGQKAGTEYAFAQASYFAVLMQGVQASSLQSRDLEPD